MRNYYLRFFLSMLALGFCLLVGINDIFAQAPPPTPSNFSAQRSSSTSVTLSWSYSGVSLVEFRIWRRQEGSGSWKGPSRPSPSARSYVDNGNAYGGAPSQEFTWIYRIAAYDGHYNSDPAEVTSMGIVTPQDPDLVFTSVTAPDDVDTGEDYAVDFTVENNGLAETGSDFFVYAYLSSDNILSSDDVRIDIDPKRVGAMPSNNTTSTNIDVHIPDWPMGPAYIILKVDATGVIDESDEGNNYIFTPVNIDTPDIELVGRAFTLEVAAGGTLKLKYDIRSLENSKSWQVWLG
jgi:hypothetical protein